MKRRHVDARMGLAVVLLATLVGLSPGCHWLKRGEKGVAEVDATPVEQADDAATAEPEPAEEPPGDHRQPSGDDSATREAASVADAGPSPTQAEPSAAADREVAPSPDPTEPGPESVPEIDAVSPVDLPEPRLLSEDSDESLETLRTRVAEAEQLSATLAGRELTHELAAQVESGRGFLAEAKEAIDDADAKRASVLIDKSLVLLEDAERRSRR